jgi:hypothetical protein
MITKVQIIAALFTVSLWASVFYFGNKFMKKPKKIDCPIATQVTGESRNGSRVWGIV